jgi:hypothetical protein
VSPWLVSARFDLLWLIGPAFLGLALVPLQPWLAPDGETSPWLWLVLVLLIDVAHVWSTLFRTYFDPVELARHPLRYSLIPALAYVLGLVLASISTPVFWTALAYLAVFHFVRQQYGWLALYQKKEAPISPGGRVLEDAAIYGATVVPLLWWHAHLPRNFDWFVRGDFLRGLISPGVAELSAWAYLLVLLAFLLQQARRRPWPVGKVLLVVGTACTWALGIVYTNSDFHFTVTNVIAHGVPYFAFVWRAGAQEPQRPGSFLFWLYRRRAIWAFYGILVLLAYLEEWGWDRLFWHGEQPIFFGPTFELSPGATAFLLPLLALPQATHYLLDAFIWRRQDLQARRLAF